MKSKIRDSLNAGAIIQAEEAIAQIPPRPPPMDISAEIEMTEGGEEKGARGGSMLRDVYG